MLWRKTKANKQTKVESFSVLELALLTVENTQQRGTLPEHEHQPLFLYSWRGLTRAVYWLCTISLTNRTYDLIIPKSLLTILPYFTESSECQLTNKSHHLPKRPFRLVIIFDIFINWKLLKIYKYIRLVYYDIL